MINKEDINMYSYEVIDKVAEKKDSIVFYWRDKYNKNSKRVVFKVEEPYVIGNFNGYKHIYIKCLRENLVEEINKVGFSAISNQVEYIRKKEAKERKAIKVANLKVELMNSLKEGDIVERVGKTPCLGLYLIQVEKVTDYGISGFYVRESGKRTNEYTTVAWDYIKGRWENER